MWTEGEEKKEKGKEKTLPYLVKARAEVEGWGDPCTVPQSPPPKPPHHSNNDQGIGKACCEYIVQRTNPILTQKGLKNHIICSK